MLCGLRKLERTAIDGTARRPRGRCHFGDRLFHRCPRERAVEQRIDIVVARLFGGGGRDDDHHLAARFGATRVIGGERSEVAAPDFLMQLGEFPGDVKCRAYNQ